MHYLQPLIGLMTGILAGTIDTIGGGGGLITLPVILGFNLPPAMALGTNRLQGCIGELTSSLRFLGSGQLSLTRLWPGFLCAMLGSIGGSLFAQHLPADILNYLMPALLLLLLLFFIFHRPSITGDKPKLSWQVFLISAGLIIGFYNGFFGPSTGTFWTLALIYFLAIELKPAIMQAKPLNFIGNFTSLLLFMHAGDIVYRISIPMGVGQIIGALIGAQIVIRQDTKFIRPLFIIIVTFLTIHLFYKTYGHLLW